MAYNKGELEESMVTVIRDNELARRLISQRRAWGADHHDEVWEGVYMMSPLAGNEHQRIVAKLTAVLVDVVGMTGPGEVFPGANVSDRAETWEQNYRCPDVAVFLEGNPAKDHGAHWQGGPDFLVEVISQDDQSYDKLPFYETVGTREVLIVDRKPWALVLYRLAGGKLIEAGRSNVENGAAVASEVVPLAFRLIAGQSRPQIEVTKVGTSQHWLN